MTTNRPEFKAHDDFIFEHKEVGKITREEFIKYIRSSHDHMRKLSQIIQQYNQTIDEYLNEWDGRFESFDEDVKDLLGRWIQDGTMDHIINENLMSTKADKSYVDDLNENVTAQLAQKATQHYIDITDAPFYAVGDGITDNSDAIKDAFHYGISNKMPVYIPSGVFMVMPNKIFINVDDDLLVFGDGESSEIKVFDDTINASWLNMFQIRITSDVNKIEFKDLLINNNASGSTPPDSGTGYEQSHTFRVLANKNTTLDDISFINIRINDPAADGFNNSGPGIVKLYRVLNCSVSNRTRFRSDIQFSVLPRNVFIDNFFGSSIECEVVSVNPSDIFISNSKVKRLDIDSGTECSLFLTNTKVTELTTFMRCDLNISNCELAIRANAPRWNGIPKGSVVSNSTILIPYDPSTNRVAPLDLHSLTISLANYDVGIRFVNTHFKINNDDVELKPDSALVTNSYVLKNSETRDVLNEFINCTFDKRTAMSCRVNRNGGWYFENCIFGGTGTVIHVVGGGGTYKTELTINGGDFSNVTGKTFIFEGIISETLYTKILFYGYVRGGNVGSYEILSGSPFSKIKNNRILMSENPSSAFKGDIILDNQDGYIGKVCMSNGSSMNWKKFGLIEV